MTYNSFRSKNRFSMALLMMVVVAVQVACAPVRDLQDSSDWIVLDYLIDARTELELKIPPTPKRLVPPNLQFVRTNGATPVDFFSAFYDPGYGRDGDLYLTHLWGVVFQLQSPFDEQQAISLNDIKNEVYLSRPDAGTDIQVIGERSYAGRSWLRVNLNSSPEGVSYATPIDKDLVLVLSMSAFGDNTFGTRLFEKRIETLEAMVESVTFSNMDD